MKLATLRIASVLGVLGVPAAADPPGARTPLTHEAIFLMKRVGSPVPSPEGRRVVFTVTEPAYDEKKESADIWIVPADGSAKPRRLTGAKGSESGPACSPHRTPLAFPATRAHHHVDMT